MRDVRPLTLTQANEYVEKLHRHHKKVQGHRFSIGLWEQDTLIGVAICGRPVARLVPQDQVLEVTRLRTDGSKNACSQLYGACARVAREMGFHKIQTYILHSETGTSLVASGWQLSHTTAPGSWSRPSRHRTDKHLTEAKSCYVKIFKP